MLLQDPAKKVFADVLFSYSDSFHKTVTASFKEEGVKAETGVLKNVLDFNFCDFCFSPLFSSISSLTCPDAAFDFMEDALSKFSDGPFFLGQFSLVRKYPHTVSLVY